MILVVGPDQGEADGQVGQGVGGQQQGVVAQVQLIDAQRPGEALQGHAAVLGQVQYKAVGSTAVRDIEAERQPLVGLHGHIHESAGIRRLGKRRGVILNPGSDYSTGALNGALVSLHKDRADAQLVRG